MRASKVASAILALVLGGCVSLQPTLLPTAQPSASSGYVAAFLARTKGSGFGLGLVNTETGAEYVIPFHDKELDGGLDLDARPVMIEVPPGNYRLATWMTYATLTHERQSRKEIPPDHGLARPFALAAGQVVVLGGLESSTETGFRVIHWKVKPRYMTEESAFAAFREAFPAFAGAPVSCLACMPPPAPRRLDAPRPAALQLKPPTLELPKREW